MELLNIKNHVKERKKSLKKYSKGASITIFQVRGNPASERYVRNKIVNMTGSQTEHLQGCHISLLPCLLKTWMKLV